MTPKPMPPRNRHSFKGSDPQASKVTVAGASATLPETQRPEESQNVTDVQGLPAPATSSSKVQGSPASAEAPQGPPAAPSGVVAVRAELQCVNADCDNTTVTSAGSRYKRGQKEYFQCTECTRRKKRFHDALQTLQPEAQDRFKALTREERATWKLENRDSIGQDLAASLKLLLHTKSSTYSDSKLKAVGDYVDEDDLKQRYKDKPEQLQNILANAETFYHPTRKVTLYLDAQFSKQAEKGESHSQSYTQDVEQEDPKFHRPAKKALVPRLRPGIPRLRLGTPSL